MTIVISCESGAVRRFIYPAPAWDESTDLELTEVTSSASDPTYVLHSQVEGSRSTVVYLHGNGSDLASISPLAGLFAGEGIDFAAIEYPGYGPARAQRTTERSILDAARRGLDHLADAGVEHERTVLVGESLGSAVAARLAHEGRGDRLVLVSPFTSMTEMYRRILRLRVLPSRLVPDRYETDALAAEIDVPTLLVHGSRDTLVPPAMSERLADAIPDARRVLVDDRDHNTLWEPPSRTLTEVVGFVRS